MLRLRVTGVPLDIRWSWLVFALVFGVLIHGVDVLLVPWVVLATVAVLVHEAGHAAVVLACGGSPQVVLHGSGGLTIGPNLGARLTFLLAAAGTRGWVRVRRARAGSGRAAAAHRAPDPVPRRPRPRDHRLELAQPPAARPASTGGSPSIRSSRSCWVAPRRASGAW